jgi:Beta-glucosidase-related glycosidases
MIDLRAKPFYLDDEGIEWVRDTLSGMDFLSKVGQLFCEIAWEDPDGDTSGLFATIEPGGVMFRPEPGADLQRKARALQSRAKVPMLIASNLERGGSGGNGGIKDGTYFGAPMQVAATDDEEEAYRLGLVAGREGAAVGVNWTFEPIIDIDRNFENPITNVRTYGSDPRRVLKMARAYMRGAQESGLAVCIKHFPGDGVDFRDQHLLASVNSLSASEWDASYGMLYRQMIEAGANSVMASHIKQPACVRRIAPSIKDEDIMPASLSRELCSGLLRDRLGFNGLIVTDATQMAGFTASMRRDRAIPTAVAAGCDMVLFTINQKEDVEYLLRGIDEGIVSQERLADAVTRVLALKASLGLHARARKGALVPGPEALGALRREEHVRWARECADRSVTLVKDRERLLPLSARGGGRALLCVVTNEPRDEAGHTPESLRFKRKLELEGFAVEDFDMRRVPGASSDTSFGIADFKARYDLVLYYANMRVASNQNSVRLAWSNFLAGDAPKYAMDVPTVFISVSNPYHLADVPMVGTYINAYSSSEFVVDALVEKLMGRSAFSGTSPVDPFCGLWDARL